MATRLAAAKARLQDAELTLVGAQWDLAGAIRLPPGQALPLPADAPHVGAYRTVLDQIYAGRTVPARAVLIDRTLPIRRGAIDARAAAIQAAGDALAATEEAYYQGRGDLARVLSLVDELARQRRAFLTDVRLYNNEIAEYALAAPTPAMDPQGLASMLIKSGASRQGAVAGGAAAPPGGVERAGFNEPMHSTTPARCSPCPRRRFHWLRRPMLVRPSCAASRRSHRRDLRCRLRAASRQRSLLPAPAPAAMRSPSPPRGLARPLRMGRHRQRCSAQRPQQPKVRPKRLTTATRRATAERYAECRMCPDLARRSIALHRQSRQIGPVPLRRNSRSSRSIPLRNKSPGEQARQLATVLCWDPSSAEGEVTPVSLAEYLATIPAERRGEALVTYWQTTLRGGRRSCWRSSVSNSRRWGRSSRISPRSAAGNGLAGDALGSGGAISGRG